MSGAFPISEMLDKNLFRHVTRVSNAERERTHTVPEVKLRQRERMAEFIRSQKSTEIVGEFYTEYRLELYVFSPDELFRYVDEQLRRYAMYYRPIDSTPPG